MTYEQFLVCLTKTTRIWIVCKSGAIRMDSGSGHCPLSAVAGTKKPLEGYGRLGLGWGITAQIINAADGGRVYPGVRDDLLAACGLLIEPSKPK